MRKKWALSRRRRIALYLSIGFSFPTLIFGWHVVLSLGALKMTRAFDFGSPDSPVEFVSSIEPVSDLVTICPAVVESSTYDDVAAIDEPDAAARTIVIRESGAMVALQISLMARRMQLDVPVLEKNLNDSAKDKLDLYAMVVPYKVKIGAGKSSPAKGSGGEMANTE
jgi:hypothetical protein